jgi:soluble lytic murein transglycosylase
MPADDPTIYLSEGKKNLDVKNYEKAISQLTAAYEKLPVLGDYALLWRSKAHEGQGDIEKAIEDIRAVKEKYKDSPLIKNARVREIELSKKKNGPETIKLYEAFVNEYPSDIYMKYGYALLLKENNETERAKKIFREIFVSASPLSKGAFGELSSSDIKIEDLIKKAKNLNAAWLFAEAEKYFREAMQNDGSGQYKVELMEGLAYSLFRQKKYKEASELYKKLNNSYWLSRSLLRARDIEGFESRLQKFMESGDRRMAAVLTAYGTIKRRDGSSEAALKILSDALSKYPSERESVLWATGWTHYLSKDYKKASEIFSQLYESSGESRYLYWKNKCAEATGEPKVVKASPKPLQHRDFYGFLSMIKSGEESRAMSNESKYRLSLITPNSSLSFERADLLAMMGFKQEAAAELLNSSRKKPDLNELIYISHYLSRLGNYKMSINLISKMPYREELHELFYPLAFNTEIEEAAKKNNIDPILVLSVIREESRFDREARSIAGALGLMQLMPQTARKFDRHVKIALKNSNELYDPGTNILIGSYYLKHLIKTFNSIPVAIAAYNAGEEAVKEWLKKGSYGTIDEFIEDIPYDETRNYVKKVLTTYFEYMRASRDADMSSAQKYIGNL